MRSRLRKTLHRQAIVLLSAVTLGKGHLRQPSSSQLRMHVALNRFGHICMEILRT